MSGYSQIETVRTKERLEELGFTIGQPVYLFTQNGINYYAATVMGNNKRGKEREGDRPPRCCRGVGPCRCNRIHFDEFGNIHSVRGKLVMEHCDESGEPSEGMYRYDIAHDEIWVE